MIKPSQISKKKTDTVRQKKRKALDDQTKSELRQKDSKQKAKKRKALDDQTTSNLRQKDSKQKAKKKKKLPKLKKLSRICMNQTDNANQMKGETRP